MFRALERYILASWQDVCIITDAVGTRFEGKSSFWRPSPLPFTHHILSAAPSPAQCNAISFCMALSNPTCSRHVIINEWSLKRERNRYETCRRLRSVAVTLTSVASKRGVKSPYKKVNILFHFVTTVQLIKLMFLILY